MNDYPPPYGPHPSSSSLYPPALGSQSTAFPGSSYQTFPQSYTGGAGGSAYQPGPQGPYMNQPGYQGYQSGPPGPYGDQGRPNTTVVVVEQQRPREEESGGDGFMEACYAALCCCCLMDMLEDEMCDDCEE